MPRSSTAHHELGLFTSIINQENTLWTLQQGNLMEAILQIEVSSSQVYWLVSCVNLTKVTVIREEEISVEKMHP